MYMINHGVPVRPDAPASFAFIGQGYFGPVPAAVVIMLVLMVIFTIIMQRTRFGRYIYATGGNEYASRLSGVRVDRVKLAVYIISATIAALAGIILIYPLLSSETPSCFCGEPYLIRGARLRRGRFCGG